MARSTMAALIARVRLLINDTDTGDCQVFTDDQIQEVLDESREDVYNGKLRTDPTFTGTTIQYLDYFAPVGGWEDSPVLKQYLTTTVTPSAIEPIVGHFQFSASTLPPVFITGRNYDIYRAAADLLERQSAQWALRYSMTVEGQSLQRGLVVGNLQKVANTYRMKQRPRAISMRRSDIASGPTDLSLKATAIDYIASGDGQ